MDKEWKERFVLESNKIDSQPGHKNEPGDPHFDDHLQALESCFASAGMLIRDAKRLHFTLMVNLKDMEEHAGVWRRCGVMVGGRVCPDWQDIPRLMGNWVKEVAASLEDPPATPQAKKDLVWRLHVDYEHIHPFIDGNGRSGRLLMVNHALFLGLEPWIVEHANVADYYARF